MNETRTEETALYALSLTYLEESPKETSQEIEVIEGEIEEIKPQPFYKRPLSKKWCIFLCSCMLLITTSITTVLLLLFNTTATVTIVRAKKTVSTQTVISLPASHIFPPISQSATQSAPATGKGYQDATFASGTVTFYNGAPYSQTVTAGTLLTGADGLQIATEQDAIIPPVAYPTLGQTTVKAQAVIAGATGNIPAGDIYGLCCRLNVSAVNQAFIGGHNERNFTTVTQNDIATLTNSITSKIDQHIQQDFDKQLLPTETLTPNLCSQNIVPTSTVGQEATTVAVTVTKTCKAASYKQSTVSLAVKKAFQEAILNQLGTSYIPVGFPNLTINDISLQEDFVRFTTLIDGTAVYQFSNTDIQQLKHLVAGKNRQQAVQLLLKWNNIRFAAIQMPDNQNTLPTNLDRISVNMES